MFLVSMCPGDFSAIFFVSLHCCARDEERGMSYGGMNVHNSYVFSIPFLAI